MNRAKKSYQKQPDLGSGHHIPPDRHPPFQNSAWPVPGGGAADSGRTEKLVREEADPGIKDFPPAPKR